jgi:NAD(P)H-dependent FMN reductase
MYDNDFKILGLAGSLRRASFHRGLIRAARELVPEGVAVELYEGLDEIHLTDEETRERMRRFLVALVGWTERFKEPANTYERST